MRASSRETVRLWLPFLSALAAGVLFSFAAPPRDWSWLAWMVPGILLVPARRLTLGKAYLCGTLYAVVIGSIITSWAPHAALEYFDSSWLQARLFILGVHVANPGIPCGLMVVAYVVLASRVRAPASALLAALLWVASEWLRVWSLGWEILGHTQYRQLALIQIADVGGVYAVSFVMVFASVAVAEILADGRGWMRRREVSRRLVWPTTALVLVLLYGQWGVQTYAGGPAEPAEHSDGIRRIAIVQGNIPNQYRWKRAYFGRTLATYAELTSRVRQEKPDLIVWPENAVNFYLNRDALLRSQMKGVAASATDGLLLGAPRRGAGQQAYNSIYLLGHDGEIRGTYDKQRLVPFGEYNPIAALGSIPGADDVIYAAGAGPSPLNTGSLRLAPMICYEVLFPGLVSNLVRQGAEVLFNLSNDSWMDTGDGAAPKQHLSMAIFRAVETRRYLVRASSSGTSGFVDPAGRLYGEIAAGTSGSAVAAVVPRHELTPYVRFGDTWIPCAALLFVLALAWGKHSSHLRSTAACRPALGPRSYVESVRVGKIILPGNSPQPLLMRLSCRRKSIVEGVTCSVQPPIA